MEATKLNKADALDYLGENVTHRPIFGKRTSCTVIIPQSVPLNKVFGIDGFLYWAKMWNELEQEADGDFSLEVQAIKPEYMVQFVDALYDCGGTITA